MTKCLFEKYTIWEGINVGFNIANCGPIRPQNLIYFYFLSNQKVGITKINPAKTLDFAYSKLNFCKHFFP